MNQNSFQVKGTSAKAPFTLTIHRGDGMALIAMNWKNGQKPPRDFVGFAIEYKEPKGKQFFPIGNRISFAENTATGRKSSFTSPFQKFRWVHFARNPELPGKYTYRVHPVFMDVARKLRNGDYQQAALELRRDTYPGQLNVAFTRGFIASQAFATTYASTQKEMDTLIPSSSTKGIKFKPTHPKTTEALDWMGFEARRVITELLGKAIADKTAKVSIVAYDLSEGNFVRQLEKLGDRLQIIIDDSKEHGAPGSGESQAAKQLRASGAAVQRQHMGTLQHNKTIIIEGSRFKAALGGSTNYSWRGFFIQSNNAIVVQGAKAIQPFKDAFTGYWGNKNKVAEFAKSKAAGWQPLGLAGIDAQVCFSPHNKNNTVINSIAKDIGGTESSLLFSLAFLNITPGVVKSAITKLKKDNSVFCYGLADKPVKGFELTKPDGKVTVVSPKALTKNLPATFVKEMLGGKGVNLHHKFLVLDFNKPTARVYTGSYNFSIAADGKNGENLWLIKDRRIATSYMVASLAMFDHYHFRVLRAKADAANSAIVLKKPPVKANEKAWWEEDYTNERKILDRKLFS